MPRNRKIFNGRTIGEWSGGERQFRKPNIELQKYVAARINGGMITAIDSADIPIEVLQLAKNSKVVFDKTSRRDGLIEFSTSKPDSSPVLKMASIKHPSGVGYTYRFTPETIHYLSDPTWTPVTQTVPLVGTQFDRINIATVFDIIAFTNNGANNVQWIDSLNEISDDLIQGSIGYEYEGPNSKFRYCTGFFNRIVLAALREENEILLAWTGEFGSKNTPTHGFEDLDPLENETSGFAPLIESPSDNSDFITGVFGLSSVLVIFREKSIWVATKQASATNPFNAYPSVSGLGCDTPFSVALTAYGLSWLDRRTRTVYSWSPGNTPEPIGRPIEKSIISNITDPDAVFGIYDPTEDSYSVCIPSVSSPVVQVWTYYFRAQCWTYNELFDLTSFDDIELLTGFVRIDDLVGVIDDLTGTIDELSPIIKGKQQRIYGFDDGELALPDPTVDDDMGVEFETFLISKAFVLPSDDTYVAKIVVEYEARMEGEIELWYAPDGGVNRDSSFILGDSFPITVLNKPQIITFRQVVHSRRYAFGIKARSGQFDILSYEVWVTPAGESSMTRQV